MESLFQDPMASYIIAYEIWWCNLITIQRLKSDLLDYFRENMSISYHLNAHDSEFGYSKFGLWGKLYVSLGFFLF